MTEQGQAGEPPLRGAARSYRQLGGTRYKASSRGKRTRLICPRCGVKRWHSVERRREVAAGVSEDPQSSRS